MPSDLSLHMAPPDCNSVGSGKHPGNACNQYYECIKIMWWYNLKTQVCPDSQVFDPTTKHCLDGSCSTTATITTIQPTNEETIVSKTTKTTDSGGTATSKEPTYSSAEENACFNSTLSTSAITTTATPSPAVCNSAGKIPSDLSLTTCFFSVAPPDCNSVGSGKYPGNACNQYYECIKIMWWYNLKTQVCPDGQVFDPTTKDCLDGSCSITATITTTSIQPTNEETVVSKTTKTIDSGGTATSKEPTYSSAEENTGFTSTLSTSATTTTATPSPAVISPDCNSVGPGKYPGESCNEYYECIKVMWWYNLKTQVCPDGQIFSPRTKNCLDGSCSETETSTTQVSQKETSVSRTSTKPNNPGSTTAFNEATYTSVSSEDNTDIGNTPPTPAKSTTSAPPPADFPPICKLVGPGKYPAENCQHYYKCMKVLWWYVTKSKKCPHGKVFSRRSRKCIVGTCTITSTSIEITTTTSMDRTTSSSVQISPPICPSVGPGNYPAENCRQYYQCTKTLWWYNSKLKVCPDGQSFDSKSNKCVARSCTRN
nr:unnamed protein product [Callosobruchus analis]